MSVRYVKDTYSGNPIPGGGMFPDSSNRGSLSNVVILHTVCIIHLSGIIYLHYIRVQQKKNKLIFLVLWITVT